MCLVLHPGPKLMCLAIYFYKYYQSQQKQKKLYQERLMPGFGQSQKSLLLIRKFTKPFTYTGLIPGTLWQLVQCQLVLWKHKLPQHEFPKNELKDWERSLRQFLGLKNRNQSRKVQLVLYASNLWWIGLHLYHVDMQIFAKIVSLKLRESGPMKENAQVAERTTLLDNASTLICDFYLASGNNYQLVILIMCHEID